MTTFTSRREFITLLGAAAVEKPTAERAFAKASRA
jgi:hypothetical protein